MGNFIDITHLNQCLPYKLLRICRTLFSKSTWDSDISEKVVEKEKQLI